MGKREDYVQQLAEYLRKNLKKGYTKDSLRWALINQGHSKLEVDKAIKRVEEEMSRDAPILSVSSNSQASAEILHQDSEPEKKSWWNRWFG
ncbi:hypothetical protein J4461_00520 [Candidatus Pacearchaeota archaeon]|nr:hypothetical protein [Candidatus Pacearchaeota archaeon]